MRTVIVGGPRTGKTTRATLLGAAMSVPVRHTDETVGKLDWSAASQEVSTWFNQPGDWIVEGASTARALRKWLRANPEGKPCDRVSCQWDPVTERSPGQETMAKGTRTVWLEILPELIKRGVAVDSW